MTPPTVSLDTSIHPDWLVAVVDDMVHSLRNLLAQNLAEHENMRLDLKVANVPETIIAESHTAFNQSIERHKDALENIRDSIRVQFSTLDALPQRIDLITLIDSRILFLHWKMRHLAPIHLRDTPHEPIFVQCDVLRLSRVLQFLLSMPTLFGDDGIDENTIIRRTDAERQVSIYRTAAWAECVIIDEGFVVDQARIDYLDTSRDAPTTVPSAFTGAARDYTILTLATCKRIIEMNGGTLTLMQSHTPTGLCITIRLPLAEM